METFMDQMRRKQHAICFLMFVVACGAFTLVPALQGEAIYDAATQNDFFPYRAELQHDRS